MLHNATEQSKDPIKVAIVDFDNCANADFKKNPAEFLSPGIDNYLSPELMTALRQGEYEEIHGCTHRTLGAVLMRFREDYIRAEILKRAIAYFKIMYAREGSGLSPQNYYEKIFQLKYPEVLALPAKAHEKPKTLDPPTKDEEEPEALDLSTEADITGVDSKDHLTIRIAQNIEKATGIKLETVSTPYDKTAPKDEPRPCGYGFRKLFTPFEKEFVDALSAFEAKDHPALSDENFQRIQTLLDDSDALYEKLMGQCITHRLGKKIDRSTKNSQIEEIVADIQKRHPGRKVIVDIFDDKEEILLNAHRLKLSNTVINTFQHDAYDRKAPAALDRTKTALRANSLLKLQGESKQTASAPVQAPSMEL